MPVHPHASGDSSLASRMKLDILGSPPREWGQRWRLFLELWVWRFTPTRVGTAPPRRFRRDGGRVHPHASGTAPPRLLQLQTSGFTPTRVGQRRRVAAATDPAGSPPREWGQRASNEDRRG